ncbi:hypothetical protein KC327_g84 [Hortaea werneckii]|nr:hypothetical protein KC327_g84 [Hortaea werneckii]
MAAASRRVRWRSVGLALGALKRPLLAGRKQRFLSMAFLPSAAMSISVENGRQTLEVMALEKLPLTLPAGVFDSGCFQLLQLSLRFWVEVGPLATVMAGQGLSRLKALIRLYLLAGARLPKPSSCVGRMDGSRRRCVFDVWLASVPLKLGSQKLGILC